MECDNHYHNHLLINITNRDNGVVQCQLRTSGQRDKHMAHYYKSRICTDRVIFVGVCSTSSMHCQNVPLLLDARPLRVV